MAARNKEENRWSQSVAPQWRLFCRCCRLHPQGMPVLAYYAALAPCACILHACITCQTYFERGETVDYATIVTRSVWSRGSSSWLDHEKTLQHRPSLLSSTPGTGSMMPISQWCSSVIGCGQSAVTATQRFRVTQSVQRYPLLKEMRALESPSHGQ